MEILNNEITVIMEPIIVALFVAIIMPINTGTKDKNRAAMKIPLLRLFNLFTMIGFF